MLRMEFSYGEFCVVCKNTSFAKYFNMYIHTIISGDGGLNIHIEIFDKTRVFAYYTELSIAEGNPTITEAVS